MTTPTRAQVEAMAARLRLAGHVPPPFRVPANYMTRRLSCQDAIDVAAMLQSLIDAVEQLEAQAQHGRALAAALTRQEVDAAAVRRSEEAIDKLGAAVGCDAEALREVFGAQVKEGGRILTMRGVLALQAWDALTDTTGESPTPEEA